VKKELGQSWEFSFELTFPIERKKKEIKMKKKIKVKAKNDFFE
jgi:hypothetical protein